MQRSATTRADAERALTALLAELDRGVLVATGRLTVAELADEWLDTMVGSDGWKASTEMSHRAHWRRVAPHLASLAARDVRPAHLSAVWRAMTADGATPRHVRNVAGTVRQMFRWAIGQGLVAVDPTIGATLPKIRTVERPTVTDDDVARVLAAEHDPMWRAWLTVMAGTGARPAEVCALRWGDIDVDAGEIVIRRSLERVSASGYEPGTTKSDRARLVDIDSGTRDAIVAWRHHRARRDGEAPDPDGWLWTTLRRPDRPVTPHHASKRWARLRAEVDIADDRTLYSLRHWHISRLLASGAEPRDVAARVGHLDAGLTMRVYAHSTTQGRRRIRQILDASPITFDRLTS